MSDDLIKQWDEYIESMGSVMGAVEHMAQQMRDRIKQLEKERKAMAMRDAGYDVYAGLEAKLTKAVEALKKIVAHPYCWRTLDATRAVLAELEGDAL